MKLQVSRLKGRYRSSNCLFIFGFQFYSQILRRNYVSQHFHHDLQNTSNVLSKSKVNKGADKNLTT